MRLIVTSLTSLIATARVYKDPKPKDPEQDPTLPFVTMRYQLWLRELSRMVCTTGPGAEQGSEFPEIRFSDDLADLESPMHFPMVHCRECYAMGWGAMKRNEDRQITPNLQSFYTGFF